MEHMVIKSQSKKLQNPFVKNKVVQIMLHQRKAHIWHTLDNSVLHTDLDDLKIKKENGLGTTTEHMVIKSQSKKLENPFGKSYHKTSNKTHGFLYFSLLFKG